MGDGSKLGKDLDECIKYIYGASLFSVYHAGIRAIMLGPVSIRSIKDGNHGGTCIPCVNLKQVSATERKGKGG